MLKRTRAGSVARERAGDQGIEPRPAVLETAILAVGPVPRVDAILDALGAQRGLERVVRALVEQPEARLLDRRVRVQRLAHRADRDLGRLRRAGSRRRRPRWRGTRPARRRARRPARSRGGSRRRAARARPRSPPCHTGPTAWITCRTGSSPGAGELRVAGVAAAERRGTPRAAPGPAARWIAPSTPPPPSRLELAALTIASASASVVMSPWCSVIVPTSGRVRGVDRRRAAPPAGRARGADRVRRRLAQGRVRPRRRGRARVRASPSSSAT